jgi:hypothetical protein
VRSMAPELNGGEGVTFLVQEAALKLKEAPRPAYGERGGVRWLGTDGAVENRGGAATMAYQRKAAVGVWTKCTGKVPFIAAYRIEATWTCTRREGRREVMAQLSVVAERACARVAQSAVSNNGCREGHARGWKFCPYASVEVVSWTGRVLAMATRRAWACQRTVPTRHGARELEARRPHAVSVRNEEA